MSRTNIEWTERTWNPVTGCTKVSAGCKHCYAETIADRFWKTQYPPIRTVAPNRVGTLIAEERPRVFTDVQTHEDRLTEPLRWRKPTKVFVNSMSDLFHEDVPAAFIDRVFAVMALTPQHTFQILTKRPERMLAWAKEWQPEELPEIACVEPATLTFGMGTGLRFANCVYRPWPLPNVWLGTSCENQETADERIPLLLQTPAAVRFISAEPLLGPINVRPYLDGHEEHGTPFSDPPARTVGGCIKWTPPLDWVIVGGESGPGARPCDRRWIYNILRQCRTAGVPVFIKQLGARSHIDSNGSFLPLKDRKGGDLAEFPPDLQVREYPLEAISG